MNSKKAKTLRAIAKASGANSTTTYVEKTTVKEVVTNDLDAKGNRIKVHVERVTRLLDANCERHLYQSLKRH